MKRLAPFCLVPLISLLFSPPSTGEEITWTATGTVDAVTGSGFAAVGAGDAVTVKFSYQTGLTAATASQFIIGSSFYSDTEFTGSIGLKCEVTIGADTWKAELPTSPAGGVKALHTVAWSGNGPSDIFNITASSQDAAVFAPFPFPTVPTSRSIGFVLRDGTQPSQFIQAGKLPMDWSEVAQLTSASGFVQADGDRLDFTLAPSSVRVASDTPAPVLDVARTEDGIALKWTGASGVLYQLQECDALGAWQVTGTFDGFDSEIVVDILLSGGQPPRRFYRVVTEGSL
jgi:hypothetical protein